MECIFISKPVVNNSALMMTKADEQYLRAEITKHHVQLCKNKKSLVVLRNKAVRTSELHKLLMQQIPESGAKSLTLKKHLNCTARRRSRRWRKHRISYKDMVETSYQSNKYLSQSAEEGCWLLLKTMAAQTEVWDPQNHPKFTVVQSQG